MSTMKKTIGFVQLEPLPVDPEANRRRAEEWIRRAEGVDLLVLPELMTSGYDMLDRGEAISCGEPFGEGATSRWLMELAKETETTLVIGYPEVDNGRVYNAAQLAAPDGTTANYRKTHLFDREKELFDPGDEEPPVVETPAGRIGLMICFDWIFPEVSRLLALKGAQVIAHPSNLVLQFCQRAMFARCVENGVFAVTANRIGTETRAGRELTFTGASQVMSPKGTLLAGAPDAEEHMGWSRVDLAAADEKMITERNHRLMDRRTDLYGRLIEQQRPE